MLDEKIFNMKENSTLIKLDHNLLKTQLESIKKEETAKLEKELLILKNQVIFR